MTVRGTSFVAGRREGDYTGAVFVTMLSGYGVLSIAGACGTVTEVNIPAGSMVVTTPDVRPAYTIRHDFDIEAMGLFELNEVYARSGDLIAAGVLTPVMYEQLPAVINRRQTERNLRRGQEDASLAQAAAMQDGFAAAPEAPVPVAGPPPITGPLPGAGMPAVAHAQLAVNRGESHIISGDRTFFAIADNGDLWAWGRNSHGQLGDGTTESRQGTEPVRIMQNVIAVSGGGNSAVGNHSMAITADGVLWGWGGNWEGQLGDGTTIHRHSPVRIMDNVVAVSAGYYKTAAITADGGLWVWGSGRLGDGTNRFDRNNTDQLYPLRIKENVIAISSSGHATFAITSDNVLWGWGLNSGGRLGDGTNTNRLYPVRIMDNVVAVSAGSDHAAAITADGSLWTWGRNRLGQLGDGTTTDSNVPIRVMENAAFVSAASGNTMVITNDNVLWGWGSGPDLNRDRSRTRIMDNVAAVNAESISTLAVRMDGTLLVWGNRFNLSLPMPRDRTVIDGRTYIMSGVRRP